MEPKHFVLVGGLLVAVPVVLTLLGTVWIVVPVGLAVILVGLALWGFQTYQASRLRRTERG